MTYRLVAERRKRTLAFAQTVKNIANMTKEILEELKEKLEQLKSVQIAQSIIIDQALDEIKYELSPPEDIDF